MSASSIRVPPAAGDKSVEVFRAVVLAALTASAIYLCWRLTAPFLNAFLWSFTLTIACAPLRTWLFKRMPKFPATLLIIALVTIVIAVPVTVVLRQLLQESLRAQSLLRNSLQSQDWAGTIAANRWLGPLWMWVDQQLDLTEIAQRIGETIARWIAPALAHSVSVVSQAGTALLAFFFFLRDQEAALAGIRRLLPLPDSDIDHLFTRVANAVRTAVFGRLFIGCLQGFLGGVIFALVGLPAAVFWGAVMSFLSVLPVFGAFVVWIPASLFLLLSGHWIRAVIVVVWGLAVIHPIDNLLYPVLVGARLGMHPLVLFIAFVGGLIAFGPMGLILGPCIIAFAAGMVELWHARSAVPQQSSA